MIAAYLNSLLEAVNRRMALVLAGVALLVAGVFLWIVQMKPLPDGTSVILLGNNFLGPAILAVPAVFRAEIQQTGALWLLLAIFAAAPLLSSSVEKGWLELTFSKGTSRWQIFLGRFLGGLTLYFLTFLLATFPVALRLWWKTGVGPLPLAVALLIQTFSFAALLAVVALATLPQKGMALPIMAAVAVWFISPILAWRQGHVQFVFNLAFCARRFGVGLSDFAEVFRAREHVRDLYPGRQDRNLVALLVHCRFPGCHPWLEYVAARTQILLIRRLQRSSVFTPPEARYRVNVVGGTPPDSALKEMNRC